MGYVCPVCEIPQADGDHLANHLAITAILHGDEHEAWLDDYVPEWETTSESTLGELVTEFATVTEYETVFEDTTDQPNHHPQSDGHNPPVSQPDSLEYDRVAILREAQQLTDQLTRDEDSASDDQPPEASQPKERTEDQ